MSTTNTAPEAVTAAANTGSALPADRAAGDEGAFPSAPSADAEAQARERLREWDAKRLVAAGIAQYEAGGIAGTITRFLEPSTNPHLRPILGETVLRGLRAHAQRPGLEDLIGIVKAILGDGDKAMEGALAAPVMKRPQGRGQQSSHPGSDGHSGAHTTSIELDQIIFNPQLQPRQKQDDETVLEYADAMETGAEFPPVIVFRDINSGRLALADGAHRVAAARRAGFTAIRAEVRNGTMWDALRHALGSNSAHGLRRTRADVAKAIRLAYDNRSFLSLPDVPSARLIADLVGCSDKTAQGELRRFRSWKTATIRTGADGKARSVPQPKPIKAKEPPPASQAPPTEPAAPPPSAPSATPQRIAPQDHRQHDVPPPPDTAAIPAASASVLRVQQPERQTANPGEDLSGVVLGTHVDERAGPDGADDPAAEDILRLVVQELGRDASAPAGRCASAICEKIRLCYPAFFRRAHGFFAHAALQFSPGV
jgi:hypothetical protein